MITIERTTATEYENKDYEVEEALKVLNFELENKKLVWIDNKPFQGEFVTEQDISKAKQVCVTNKLVGG